MSYTRRSVLRNAALLSLAGAANSTPLSLFGQACTSPSPGSRPVTFATPGIRIFFCGAWLFVEDPQKPGTNMLAVTQDLPGPSPSHYFPYGIWQPGFDANPSLSPIHQNGTYQIAFDKISSPAANVDALFDATLCRNPFSYLVNHGVDLSIDITQPSVRAISIPLPSQLTSAAFIVGAALAGDGGKRLKAGPKNPRVSGLATAHIFDYWDATSLTLTDGLGDLLNVASANVDYHFHTIPLATWPGHAPMMFANLLGLINSKTNSFSPDDLKFPTDTSGCMTMDIGPDTPMSVSEPEVDIQDCIPNLISQNGSKGASLAQKDGQTTYASDPNSGRKVFNVTLASCAGGGLGVGGGH
jgi:hypothetical protein